MRCQERTPIARLRCSRARLPLASGDETETSKREAALLLEGLAVVQMGVGQAAAVCGRMLADLGADVACTAHGEGGALRDYLDHGKRRMADADAERRALATADVVIVEGSPRSLQAQGRDLASLRRVSTTAVVVAISPFGQSGPKADDPATDLTLFFASGMSRLLTGQVEDVTEPPLRPVGEQSIFIAGLAAASAGMTAVFGGQGGAFIDVSMQEALATLAMTELTRAGVTGKSWGRKRVADGNGATVTILPASDGYVAISPREEKQWASWLVAMSSPAWGSEPRFARKRDRVEHWDALHALMSEWSRRHDKHWIARTAQEHHVPSFPLCEVAEHLDAPQMQHRRFYRSIELAARAVKAPGPPFGLTLHAATNRSRAANAPLPLAGVRVLDFSWVIAGPTTTRYLAAMGAEVIKVEAPGAGDPARQSELHTVLGQAKKAIVLDLKRPEGLEIARALASKCDVLVENYATGVMDRLGLGADALRAINPDLIYVSASGMGRTGPDAYAVAYGTLLQSYTGFAGLNRHPGSTPRIGFAWCDPMCALMLSFIAAAALWQRARSGKVARVDFSMIEAMLWSMAEPVLAAQTEGAPQPAGNASRVYAPHGVYRCAGDDDWVSVVVLDDGQWRALCSIVPGLDSMAAHGLDERRASAARIDAALGAWAAALAPFDAEARLLSAGVAAAALARSGDLVRSAHLAAREFWTSDPRGVLPGLPWRASFGRAIGPAPALGADTEAVLREVLGYSDERIVECRRVGALG